jgi:hypothetical protein
VFVRGTNDRLYLRRWNGSTWQGWATVGTGLITGDPAAVSWSSSRTDVVARGGFGQLHHFAEVGSTWYEDDLGVGISSTLRPGLTSYADSELDVYAIDPTNTLLLHRQYSNFEWHDWSESFELSGVQQVTRGVAPPAVNVIRSGLGALGHLVPGVPTVDLFLLGPDGRVWHRSDQP